MLGVRVGTMLVGVIVEGSCEVGEMVVGVRVGDLVGYLVEGIADGDCEGDLVVI